MRGFTMFLVVFWHIMSNSFGLGDSVLGAFFRTFRMPMFFFVSGYIGYKAIETFDATLFRKLFRHKAFVQLVPTIIIYSIYQFVQGNTPLVYFKAGLVGYWFTLALFELFTLYYITNFILNKWFGGANHKLQEILFGIAICTTWVVGLYINHLQDQAPKIITLTSAGNVFTYMPFFCTGILARKYNERFVNFVTGKYLMPLNIAFFVIGFLITERCITRESNIVAYYLMTCFVLRFAGLFSVFALFHLSADYFDKNGRISKAMQFIGSHTLDIYLLHYFFIPDLLQYKEFFMPAGKEYILAELVIMGSIALFTIGLCLLISSTLRKSEVLAKYLFGIVPKKRQ